jgi:vacuolar iron transporter family protein
MTDVDAKPTPVKDFQEFFADEQAAAWLYRALAAHADGEAASTLERLAKVEDEHAGHWARLIERQGGTLPKLRIGTRERVIAWVGRTFGVERVLPMLVRFEAADAGKYLHVPEAPNSMAQDEMEHGATLAGLVDDEPDRVMFREGRHRTGSGGALRAATFGVNDGLVSNLALVMGVAGGTGDGGIVLLAGVAGLIAGALSMAAGEWISVQSMRELFEREIRIEREELRHFPRQEEAELALIYQSKGISQEQAWQLAREALKDEATALDTLAREELGLDPNELGNPWVAAGSSFVAFAVGAFVPVLPFIITSGRGALVAATLASALMLSIVGFTISIITGRSGWFSALRMVLIGGAAAAVKYGIGSLVGVVLD